ncbi:hypothetical protein DFP72DRAFT_764418, partial [Ephemerocybe angulata]
IQFPTPDESTIIPSPLEFKCRFGYSAADPDFGYCFYSKDTGEPTGATPFFLFSECGTSTGSSMENPQCA